MSVLTSVKNNKLKTTVIIVLLFVLIMMLFMYNNKVAPVSWRLYGDTNTENGLALQGGDTVAYYTEGKYIPGDPAISVTLNGITWYFASESNKKLFVYSPEFYMPQYGGYCAFAVSKNVTADARPEYWTIQNNKLYIFNDASVKDEWVDAIDEGSLSISDTNWATRI